MLGHREASRMLGDDSEWTTKMSSWLTTVVDGARWRAARTGDHAFSFTSCKGKKGLESVAKGAARNKERRTEIEKEKISLARMSDSEKVGSQKLCLACSSSLPPDSRRGQAHQLQHHTRKR